MSQKPKEIVLHGTIINATDYNTKAILGDLPIKPRNQIIEVQLDEDFWQIVHIKKVKIIINKDQLPKFKK
jgi:hypothetical protein